MLPPTSAWQAIEIAKIQKLKEKLEEDQVSLNSECRLNNRACFCNTTERHALQEQSRRKLQEEGQELKKQILQASMPKAMK